MVEEKRRRQTGQWAIAAATSERQQSVCCNGKRYTANENEDYYICETLKSFFPLSSCRCRCRWMNETITEHVRVWWWCCGPFRQQSVIRWLDDMDNHTAITLQTCTHNHHNRPTRTIPTNGLGWNVKLSYVDETCRMTTMCERIFGVAECRWCEVSSRWIKVECWRRW